MSKGRMAGKRIAVAMDALSYTTIGQNTTILCEEHNKEKIADLIRSHAAWYGCTENEDGTFVHNNGAWIMIKVV